MTEKKLEEKIAKAVDNAVPDIIGNVLSQCDNEKGKVIYMKERRNKFSLAKLGAVAAAVLMVVGLFGSMSSSKMDSTVFLDVNPSIELIVNKNDRIKSAKALNSDAERIMEDMNLKNTDLEVGVNAIIGSMLKNGYISDLSNSILVSVENKNEAKNEELQKKITDQINDVLGVANVEAAVLSQSVNKKTPEVDVLCEKYGISKGKAELILSIREKDPKLLEKDLVGLTINELNLIMDSKNLEVNKVVSKGEPSAKKYIDSEKAKEIALANLGVSNDKIKNVKVSLDSENNELVYDVEVYLNGKKYEVNVNAVDGRIVSQEVKITDKVPSNNDGKDRLTLEEAQIKALRDLGISKEDAGYIYAEPDTENGRQVYEVKFVYDGYKYSMTIDAYTGEVLEREVKENKLEFIESGKPSSGKIEVEKAVDTILDSLGISRKDAGYIDIDVDKEDGRLVYEAKFRVGNKEYSVTVDANTGKIIDKEIKDKTNNGNISLDFKISKEDAKKIAMEAIGSLGSNVGRVNITKDVDDGRACYEAEIIANGKEYTVKIDAATGNILEKSEETADRNDLYDHDFDDHFDDHDFDDDDDD